MKKADTQRGKKDLIPTKKKRAAVTKTLMEQPTPVSRRRGTPAPMPKPVSRRRGTPAPMPTGPSGQFFQMRPGTTPVPMPTKPPMGRRGRVGTPVPMPTGMPRRKK